MIKVVSFKICPFVQRVTGLLEAKQIPYSVEYISLSDKPRWFLDISPHGQVPVLITEQGTPLFESDAIVEYLEEAYPALEEGIALEQKAVNRAWSYLATKNYLTQCSAQRSADKVVLEERSTKLNKAFTALEQALGESVFFGGTRIGMVDIAWLPILHRAAIIERCSGYDFLEQYPAVKRWQEALLETGLAEKSVAEDFIASFTGFYLSDQTYLGGLRSGSCMPVANVCSSSVCC